jgi:2-dehydro-3-deoxyphosphogluconate aldolase / (4S)-4-hydroxy-2-oxoglutarate aldolase
MKKNQNGILELLSDKPLIPVVTIKDLEQLDNTIETLLSRDINCIEITLRTSVSWQAIERAKKNHGDRIKVGVGTIINQDQIYKAMDLNVDFLVSPGFTPQLIKGLEESKIPFLPGVSNVSQIISAIENNCNTLKFFPAILSGGLQALENFYQLFPLVKFCPTGGIGAVNFKSFLELKNVISVGGSWLSK